MSSALPKLLVVEDEYFIATELAQILRESNFEVLGPVSSIGDAMCIVDSEKIDGAVLDLNLDGELTFELARMLQERGIPIVIVTGYDRHYVPDELGDVPVFRKPFVATELEEALSRLRI
ncbi:DNA-binding response OmpR family regulator [Sphingomonas zeicaulis]|uniref:response regulator n=1 Tax=Sphingomonas zeicaulis TaxID=1632740 RepID=UPI003D20576F